MVFCWVRNDISPEWQAKARSQSDSRWPDETVVYLNPKTFTTPEIVSNALTKTTALSVVPEGAEIAKGIVIACPNPEPIIEGYRIAAEFLQKSIEIVVVSEPD